MQGHNIQTVLFYYLVFSYLNLNKKPVLIYLLSLAIAK